MKTFGPLKNKMVRFYQQVRTNNDAEGWQHNRLNERERAKLSFYELVPKLFAEARLIPMQNKLFCKKKC